MAAAADAEGGFIVAAYQVTEALSLIHIYINISSGWCLFFAYWLKAIGAASCDP